MSEAELLHIIDRLERRIALLERHAHSVYQGTSAIDFTTTTLPHYGDFGYQTADDEFQINAAGTIRRIQTLPL